MTPSHLTIITGASRGLGAALAAQRLREGHQVLGLARGSQPALVGLAATQHATLVQWPVDLANPGPVAAQLAAWLAARPRQATAGATLINNAALVTRPGPAAETDLEEIAQALRVGLEATVVLTAAFLHATRGWAGPRKVLNISSGLGRRAMAGSAVYCAAKAGVDHFSRALALEDLSELDAARAGFEQVLALNPAHSEALSRLAVLAGCTWFTGP